MPIVMTDDMYYNVMQFLMLLIFFVICLCVLLMMKLGIITKDDLKNYVRDLCDGIYNLVKSVANFLKHHKDAPLKAFHYIKEYLISICGTDSQEYAVATNLILNEEDVTALSKRFNAHPYDTPIFNTYWQNSGIVWYDFRAVGLTATYKGLAGEELAKMLMFRIQNYFMETRFMHPDISIKVATPTRLCFAVALSVHGKKLLMGNKIRNVEPVQRENVLEEEIIDAFPETEDEKK